MQRKRKARSKFDSSEASRVLNLKNIKGDVRKQKKEDIDVEEKDVALFMFWSSFGSHTDLKKHVEDMYLRVYKQKHGDPIQNWKNKMNLEADRREKNKSREKTSSKRRYGVSVAQFQERVDMTGVSTEGVGGENDGPMSQERTAKAMVSVIRNKQRKKEVENLKARTVVQMERQRRHRKAGLAEG